MSRIVLLIAGLLEVVWAIGPEIHPRFYASYAKHYHYCGDDRQYRHALLGNAHVACRNRLCGLDRYWRCWGNTITGILLLGESASPARLLSLWADRCWHYWSEAEHLTKRRAVSPKSVYSLQTFRVAMANICCFISSGNSRVRERIHR